jgi:hypothetical protein
MSSWAGSSVCDQVGVAFVSAGSVLLVADTPSSFEEPLWWPPHVLRHPNESVEHAVTRVQAVVHAPPRQQLHCLGSMAVTTATGAPSSLTLFLQTVGSPQELRPRQPATVWRSVVGGPACCGLDELLIAALTGPKPHVPLVVQTHLRLKVDERADEEKLRRAPEADLEWVEAIANRRRRRAALRGEMPPLRFCGVGP